MGPTKDMVMLMLPSSVVPPLARFCFNAAHCDVVPRRKVGRRETCVLPRSTSLPRRSWCHTSMSSRYWSTTSNTKS